MLYMYGRADGNGREAARLYSQRFPHRRQPTHKTFASIYQRLSESGTLKPRTIDRGRPRSARTPHQEERILNDVGDNPRMSTRQLGSQFQIGHNTVWRILREQLLYPYHLQRVQGLTPADFGPRVTFCTWYRQMVATEGFVIMFTDEAALGKDGIINFHNDHMWSDLNPHATYEDRHQQRFRVNVWAGILGDNLLGPHVLPHHLNGHTYHEFLTNTLPDLLDDIPLAVRTRMWFMHDGAPAHFSRVVRNLLNTSYRGRWIGRGGTVNWPPRSPDLNPLDYYLWGHLKSVVYAAGLPTTAGDLTNRIENACATIRNTPGIFARVRQSMERRTAACIDVGGGHFEQLL